jgi:hypothetical protein
MQDKMKSVEVTLGPKVRMLAGVVMAIKATTDAGGSPEVGIRLVETDYMGDFSRTKEAVQKAAMMICILKNLPDCPHPDDDEAIAVDILRVMGIDPETGKALKPDDFPPALCPHCGTVH